MVQTAASAEDVTPLPDLLSLCRDALVAAETMETQAQRAVEARVAAGGRVDTALLEREQFAAHGYAWLATYAVALRQMLGWAERCQSLGVFGTLEALTVQAAFGEFLAQMAGGIAMSQGEIVRPEEIGIADADIAAFQTDAVRALVQAGNTAAVRQRIAELIGDGNFADPALDDEALTLMQEQFRRFADEKIAPDCHDWHVRDVLIPLPLIEELSALGVFGLTVPEAYGGLGMGKMAMCVVTEELSRGYIGVGSLGTRSEIAAELIPLRRRDGGAEGKSGCPKIASGEILPTAVFTEPNTGSDLGSAAHPRRARRGRLQESPRQQDLDHPWRAHRL